MIVIVLFIVAILIYIKIKYGFWVSQPVFHIYDIQYMIYPPGIINHGLPEPNKYTNFKDIETLNYDNLSDIKTNNFQSFVQRNYLRNQDNIFAPKKGNIVPYFKGHNAKSFVSFYTEPTIVKDVKSGALINDSQIIGVMTSRPLKITINNKPAFSAYYVDYLCVDKTRRKKGIAPQIIQTHHYNQSHLNPAICVSLFKREDELTGIIPMCVYSTYGFRVDKWIKPARLHASYSIVEINPQNYHILYDFIKNNRNAFDIIIATDDANIIELVKTKNVFINAVLFNGEIVCAYFFRKSCVFIEKGMEVLSCFASINNSGNDQLFVQGFKISFWDIADKNYFGFSAIEDISHNNTIITDLRKKTCPLITSPTAYFFYNFAYSTFHSNKALILT
jgi:hypothetical protein